VYKAFEESKTGFYKMKSINLVIALLVFTLFLGASHLAVAQDDHDTPFNRQFNTQANDQPVYLEADEIIVDRPANTARAIGNVRITYGDRVLKASQIEYDLDNNRIKADGLITIINSDGTTFQATEAQLDDDLSDGLIRGARAMLSNSGRVAAVAAQRQDGNKTLLSKAVYSPCKVCEESPDPLWQVRASKMVHDETERDYVYKDVYFDVLGYPVAYLPYFRHPDETVEKRSGFLPPTIGGGSSLGYFVQVPYFIDIAPNRDITLAPIVATDESPVLAGELRGLETFGRYVLDGSLSYGDVDGKEQLRGHIFADGIFDLGQGWATGFDINRASDDVYLRKYNITDIDRLNSRIFAEKYTDSGFFAANSYAFQSFREDEFSGEIPLILPEFDAEHTMAVPYIGGLGSLHANTV
jgi:LPS-assembly protein